MPRLRRTAYRSAAIIDQRRGAVNNGPFVLCYHSVSDSAWRFAVRPRDIIRQLNFLVASYTPVTATELEAFLTGSQDVAPHSFLITFDDGYRDILDCRTTFEKCGIKPLVFTLSEPNRALETDIPAWNRLLGGDDLRSLARDGWDIGSHSATHADLTALDDKALVAEVLESKQRIEDVLGSPVRYFAYPKGRYTSRVLRACSSAGYAAAFSMDDGFISTTTNRFAIPRIGVDGTHSYQEFKTLMTPSCIRLRQIVKGSPLRRLLDY
jgi:peptidoglycan/xylan/chitin deacetylase (PgdA/CDA1 family)